MIILPTDHSMSILKNLASSSLVKMAEYAIPIVVTPFLLRTVGAATYGDAAFVLGIGLLAQLIIDFGFNISATQLASVHRHDAHYLHRLYWTIQLSKLMLTLVALALLAGLLAVSPRLGGFGTEILVILMMNAVGSICLSAWFTQGLEIVTVPSALLVGSRLGAAALLVAVVRDDSPVIVVATLMGLGNVIAGLLVTVHLVRLGRVRRGAFDLPLARQTWSASWPLFLASAASSAYMNGGVITLGFFASSEVVGSYALAEKIIKAGQSMLQPIFQVMFPRISYSVSSDAAHAARMLRRCALATLAIGMAQAATFMLFSEDIIRLASGVHDPVASGALLILSIIPLVGGMNNVVGIQHLAASGHGRTYGRVVLGVSLVGLGAMFHWVQAQGATGASLAYAGSELLLLATLTFFAVRLRTTPERAMQ